MARVMLLLLALSLGGVPGPGLAKQCSDTGLVVGEGGTRVIEISTDIKTLEKPLIVFVMPESGFQGVRVDVDDINGMQHSAWFSAKPHQCFPKKDSDRQWWQVKTWAETDTNSNNLTLTFKTANCFKTCVLAKATTALYSFQVVAYEASKWRKNEPSGDDCDIKYASNPSYKTQDCEKLPSFTSQGTTTLTTTTASEKTCKQSQMVVVIIAVVATLAAVAAMVTMVVFYQRMKSMQSTNSRASPPPAPQPAHPPANLQVNTQNDLYESFDNYAHQQPSPP